MNKAILKKKEINDKEKTTTTAPIKKKVQIVYSSSEEEEEDEEENKSASSDDDNTDVSEAEADEEEEDEVDDDVSMGSMGDDFEETKKEKETKRSKKDVITTLDASLFDDEIDDDDEVEDVDEVLSDDDDEIPDLYSKPNITPEHYVESQHPECILHNMKEIQIMCNIVRNTDGHIIDPLHTTIPFLTKYERARICGQRATQIDNGSYPLVSVPRGVINSLEIAKLELEQKVIPFIIQRPLPSGGCEYWRASDLEVL